MATHLHLDALGGVSGDMFAGALIDCRPELAASLPALCAQAGFGELVTLDVRRHDDGVLTGTAFRVSEKPARAPAVFSIAAGQTRHTHRPFRDIRRSIESSALPSAVKGHALGIFQHLAQAEARVHGTEVDAVEFHEVGAWDSIADVLCAAFLIEALRIRTCSISSLPLGRGFIESAHGRLPVPAPAVALLLEGYRFHDDGLEGERITPTGAAILRHLDARQDATDAGRRLRASGNGFGTRRFPGMSNVLRALLFDEDAAEPRWREEQIMELAFEIDDQNPEELALALEAVRVLDGVLDLRTHAVAGKKQRAATAVRVLLEPRARAAVLAACFDQTTTLGIREAAVRRAVLPRSEVEVDVDGTGYRVKLARRPDGKLTAKAELDDLAAVPDQAARARLRARIEAQALAGARESGDEWV